MLKDVKTVWITMFHQIKTYQLRDRYYNKWTKWKWWSWKLQEWKWKINWKGSIVESDYKRKLNKYRLIAIILSKEERPQDEEKCTDIR